MDDKLLLKPQDNLIFRLTSINGGVDMDKLTSSIRVCQLTDIERVLTKDLYNKILEDFHSDTLTGIYETIYNNYVVYMVVFYTAAHFIDKNAVLTTGGGSFKHQPTNSVVADYKETDRKSKYYRDLGAHFEAKFIDYMKDKTIPEYVNTNTDESSFNFGWQL